MVKFLLLFQWLRKQALFPQGTESKIKSNEIKLRFNQPAAASQAHHGETFWELRLFKVMPLKVVDFITVHDIQNELS